MVCLWRNIWPHSTRHFFLCIKNLVRYFWENCLPSPYFLHLLLINGKRICDTYLIFYCQWLILTLKYRVPWWENISHAPFMFRYSSWGRQGMPASFAGAPGSSRREINNHVKDARTILFSAFNVRKPGIRLINWSFKHARKNSVV